MARPITHEVLQSISDTQESDDIATKGHTEQSIFISGEDITNLTELEVVLEGSPDGENWAVIDRDSGDEGRITDADLNSDNNAFFGTSVAIEFVRVNVVSFTADSGTISVWIMLAANGGPGKRGQPLRGSS